MTNPQDIFSVLSLRVIYVDHLGADALLIEGRAILLIDSELDPCARALVADQALSAAAASLVA